jgi:hypothetical protein
MFDNTRNRIIDGDRQIFEQAVKQWAKDTHSTVNKDAFIGCLRSAGWIEVDSQYTRLMRWPTDLPPGSMEKACPGHFNWVFPRLLHAVCSERMEMTRNLTYN